MIGSDEREGMAMAYAGDAGSVTGFALPYIAPKLDDGQQLPTLALIGVVNFLSCTPAFLLIDRFGRRPLLVAGALGMALTMFTQSAISYFIVDEQDFNTNVKDAVSALTKLIEQLRAAKIEKGARKFLASQCLRTMKYFLLVASVFSSISNGSRSLIASPFRIILAISI
jgi:MFS family permease